MKGRQIITALVILAVLGAYLYFGEIKPKAEKEKEKAEKEAVFPGAEETGVVEVVINSDKNGKIVFKKTESGWKMEKPMDVYADSRVVESLVKSFFTNKRERVIKEPELKKFGLEDPGLSCTLAYPGGERRSVQMGKENPTGSFVYTVIDGDKSSAVLISSAVKTACSNEPEHYRYKGIVKLNKELVDRIAVSLGEKKKKYTLKKDGVTWKTEKPAGEYAKKQKAESIITSFNNAVFIDVFKGSGAAREKYGLKNPSKKVVFYEGGGKKEVLIGKYNKEKKAYYMKGPLTEEIFLMPEYTVNNTPIMEDLINKQVVIFEQDAVSRAEASWNEKYFSAVKEKNGKSPVKWEITESSGLSSEDKKSLNPSSLLSALYRLEYNREAEQVSAPLEKELYGTDKGRAEITIYGEAGKKTGSVVIGKKHPEKDEIYVKSTVRNKIYLVDSVRAENLGLPGFSAE